MQVFKFGGASVKDPDNIKNVTQILKQYKDAETIVVVSAAGKTTNALEEVVKAYFYKNGDAFAALDKVRQSHIAIMDALLAPGHPVYDEVHDLLASVEWILEEEPEDSFDYLYDQIVSLGEFLSTKIVAAYLNQEGITTTWIDVRDCIRTDETWREGIIQWTETEAKIQQIVPPLIQKGIVLTQGFIGSTADNNTTTLGREGSDFTAAIFAYALRAQHMTIWKDVPGVLNADPRLFPEAVKLDHISYQEAIEMTYYGAQVIHPKTMRPLQNRDIPLRVKSFINPDREGTLVDGNADHVSYPPVIVFKKEQALLRIKSKDFYFINEPKLSELFTVFTQNRIKVNMMLNSALNFSLCVDDRKENIEKVLEILSGDYDCNYTPGMELITIRHYDSATVEKLTAGRETFLAEKTPTTSQFVVAV